MIEQLLSFFVSSAYAADAPVAAAPQQGGGLSFMMMFVVFFIFIYFAIWRPQSKRAKEQQNLLGSLAKGDEIITVGGLIGRVTKLTDQYIAITVADNVEIMMQKSAVVSVLPKGTLKSIE
jgi:preprotein translocase subunit YajC